MIDLTAIDDAIGYMTEMRSICSVPDGNVAKAYDTALACLRECAERLENKPLTVKQIKERMGQAMWMKIIRPNKEPWVDRVFISAFGDDVVVNRGFGFKFLIVGDGERFRMKEPRLSDNEIEIYDWRPDGADLEEVVKQRRGTHD